MSDLTVPARRLVPLRWIVPALLLVAGAILFLWQSPQSDPVATSPALEQLP